MNEYKVYRLNSLSMQLLEQYPQIKEKLISLEAKNIFYTKQMECFFYNNDGLNDIIESKLKKRYDYQRNKNVHTINNALTKEKMMCYVYDYYVVIISAKKSNIFFDILYQISRSYVIMSEQVYKLEV